jgi:hypothetical protein
MRAGVGGVTAAVAGLRPSEAAAVASPWIPRGWDVDVIKTDWGASLIAGPSVTRAHDRVIMGTAVPDPWGVPCTPLDPHILLDRIARYGDQIVQLAAGPFAVVHLASGTVVSALNGIVPVFLARGTRIAVGNHPEMVFALSDGSPNRTAVELVPPGCSASVQGVISNIAGFRVSEALPWVDVQHLEEEIEEHILRAGPSRTFRGNWFGGLPPNVTIRVIGSNLVASPHLNSLDLSSAVDAFFSIRPAMANLWWQAGLRNAALFVPACERPAIDTLSLAMATD